MVVEELLLEVPYDVGIQGGQEGREGQVHSFEMRQEGEAEGEDDVLYPCK